MDCIMQITNADSKWKRGFKTPNLLSTSYVYVPAETSQAPVRRPQPAAADLVQPFAQLRVRPSNPTGDLSTAVQPRVRSTAASDPATESP